MWAFATSPHGLGLSEERFWAMTPRELSFHQRVADARRDESRAMYAAIQATLHNAWLRPQHHKGFTMDDFFPRAKKKKPQPLEEKMSFLKAMLTTAGVDKPKVELPTQAEEG